MVKHIAHFFIHEIKSAHLLATNCTHKTNKLEKDSFIVIFFNDDVQIWYVPKYYSTYKYFKR